jgi:hypothetical protein
MRVFFGFSEEKKDIKNNERKPREEIMERLDEQIYENSKDSYRDERL